MVKQKNTRRCKKITKSIRTNEHETNLDIHKENETRQHAHETPNKKERWDTNTKPKRGNAKVERMDTGMLPQGTRKNRTHDHTHKRKRMGADGKTN